MTLSGTTSGSTRNALLRRATRQAQDYFETPNVVVTLRDEEVEVVDDVILGSSTAYFSANYTADVVDDEFLDLVESAIESYLRNDCYILCSDDMAHNIMGLVKQRGTIVPHQSR